MGLFLICLFLGIALALAALFGWLGARPPNPLKGPRLLPYRLLMLLSAAAAVILGAFAAAMVRGGGT